MTNMAGLLIIAGGVFFAVIGLRGTQNVVFPGLFASGSSKSSSSSSSSGNSGNGNSGSNGIPPWILGPLGPGGLAQPAG